MTSIGPDLLALTTGQLLEVTGLTRRQLQHFETAGAVTPLKRGRPRRGHPANWSLMQTVAAAYAKAFLDAGCHPSWAYEAARWVAGQHPAALKGEFAQGKTLLALLPTGEGRLVHPHFKTHATREQRLMVAQLDLQKCYERVCRRAVELVERPADKKAGRHVQ